MQTGEETQEVSGKVGKVGKAHCTQCHEDEVMKGQNVGCPSPKAVLEAPKRGMNIKEITLAHSEFWPTVLVISEEEASLVLAAQG